MIKCSEAARLMQEYLDQELTPEDVSKFEAHVKACTDCIGHFEFDKALRMLMKKKSIQTQMNPELKDLILKKLES